MSVLEFFDVLGKEAPETRKAFVDFTDRLQSTSKLDAKTFQLIYIALQAQNGAVGPVAGHVVLAKKAGATREEVMGAVLTTMMLGINGVANCLAIAMESYDNAPA